MDAGVLSLCVLRLLPALGVGVWLLLSYAQAANGSTAIARPRTWNSRSRVCEAESGTSSLAPSSPNKLQPSQL